MRTFPRNRLHPRRSQNLAACPKFARTLIACTTALMRSFLNWSRICRDPAVAREADLVHFLHRMWSLTRDTRDGMRATRVRAGISK